MEAAAERRELRVRDLMSPKLVTVRGNAPLLMADRLMREFDVSGLPVVDRDGVLIGVVSRTDLIDAASDARIDAWQGLSVARTMTWPALTVDADARPTDAAVTMEEHGVHRLVVVEPDTGRPVGMLSTTDLVRALARGAHGESHSSV